jgi:hypothetical protein
MTTSTFKERCRNDKKYSNDTELSTDIYLEIKRKQTRLRHKLVNLKTCDFISGGSKICNLCLEEKLCILKGKYAYVSDQQITRPFLVICQPPDDSFWIETGCRGANHPKNLVHKSP